MITSTLNNNNSYTNQLHKYVEKNMLDTEIEGANSRERSLGRWKGIVKI